MTRLGDERGGAVAKLLAILLVLAICASAAVYVYGKRQQPLSVDDAHVATSDGQHDPATVGVAPRRAIYVATIVHNDGRLPVTLEGLGAAPTGPTDAYVPISLELGDGKSAKPTTGAFVPPSLDPGTGIGVVVTYAINPNLACGHFDNTPSEPAPFPPLPLRLSSYGVDTTQTIPLAHGAPTVSGITKTSCERALP
jgi:hypothetical protein